MDLKKHTLKQDFYGCFCKPPYTAWFDEGRIVEKLDQHNANWIHLGNKKLNSQLNPFVKYVLTMSLFVRVIDIEHDDL